jgi:hypothetical protein
VVPIDLFLAQSAPQRWIQSSFGSRWQALDFLDGVSEKSLHVLSLTDLWELDDSRRSDVIAPRLERNFYSRCPPEKRPRFIREQEVSTPTDEETQEKLEPDGGETPPEVVEKGAEAGTKKVYDESLVFALEKTFRYHFWLGGILQLIGGMAFAGAYLCHSINRTEPVLQMLCRLLPHWSPKLFSRSWSTRTIAHDFRRSSRTIPRSVVVLVWRSACLPCKVRVAHTVITLIPLM